MVKGTSKPKVNKRLIKTLRQLYSSILAALHVTLRWTKAHVTKDVTAESYWNSRVDKLAALGAALSPSILDPPVPTSPTLEVLLPTCLSLTLPPAAAPPPPSTPSLPLDALPAPFYDSDTDHQNRYAPIPLHSCTAACPLPSPTPIIETHSYRVLRHDSLVRPDPADFDIPTSVPLPNYPTRKRPLHDPQTNNITKRFHKPRLWSQDAQRPLHGSDEPQYTSNSNRHSSRCSLNHRIRLTRRRLACSHSPAALVEPWITTSRTVPLPAEDPPSSSSHNIHNISHSINSHQTLTILNYLTSPVQPILPVDPPSSSSHILNNHSINSHPTLPILNNLPSIVHPLLPATVHPSLPDPLPPSSMGELMHPNMHALSSIANSLTPALSSAISCLPQALGHRSSKRSRASFSHDWAPADRNDSLLSSPMHIDDDLTPLYASVDSNSHLISTTYSDIPDSPCKRQKPSSPADIPHSPAFHPNACPEAKRGPKVLDSS